ncbi:WD40/YVTN/BNR-like repeat-containing protein [Algibacter sp. L1A34]|uniref:WD40/YVTN/BNR-like repeat-containing protein n=1 Tax=Algibacter sp. L1A34 TaxID=2686365 RepID=UPI00131BAA6A|nr:IPT/TIG domain-containing protein [Algibacter sp. L1A34]
MKFTFKYIFAFTFIFFSCSKHELTIDKTEIEINQNKVRIGDTITVKGKNLDIISHFSFSGTKAEPFFISPEEMKVIVPILYNEDFNLITYGDYQIIDSTPMKLIGTFPLNYNFPYETIWGIKMINEKIVYIIVGSQLYKTTDGGYNWHALKDFGSFVGKNIFFIDENEGWIGIKDNFHFILYHTNDGGTSFNQIFDRGYSESEILGMHFSTPTNGYLVSKSGEIYHTNDNSNFDLIYNFSTGPAGDDFYFNSFSVYNNNLIASGVNSSGESVLLQGINNIFSYTILETDTASNAGISNVQLIEESQAYMSYQGNVYFKNNITSGNWEEKSGNQFIGDFHFINKSKGIGITETISIWQNNDVVFETYDGGTTWINKLSFRDFEYSTNIDFYNNTGFITGHRGKIWKHIFE